MLNRHLIQPNEGPGMTHPRGRAHDLLFVREVTLMGEVLRCFDSNLI
uniref:Uncharacterized protein n=2 Tax=Anguilla anguilla TaxID=7936 RepID=A0A0E9T1Y6_ANGAN